MSIELQTREWQPKHVLAPGFSRACVALEIRDAQAEARKLGLDVTTSKIGNRTTSRPPSRCSRAMRRCNHSATLDADSLPDETPVRSLRHRMVCTRCGLVGADVRLDWSPHTNKNTRR